MFKRQGCLSGVPQIDNGRNQPAVCLIVFARDIAICLHTRRFCWPYFFETITQFDVLNSKIALIVDEVVVENGVEFPFNGKSIGILFVVFVHGCDGSGSFAYEGNVAFIVDSGNVLVAGIINHIEIVGIVERRESVVFIA